MLGRDGSKARSIDWVPYACPLTYRFIIISSAGLQLCTWCGGDNRHDVHMVDGAHEPQLELIACVAHRLATGAHPDAIGQAAPIGRVAGLTMHEAHLLEAGQGQAHCPDGAAGILGDGSLARPA